MSEKRKVITVAPDKPAILAQRLVRRLLKDSLIEPGPTPKGFDRKRDVITEALADEIHQDIRDARAGASCLRLDATLRA